MEVKRPKNQGQGEPTHRQEKAKSKYTNKFANWI